MIDDLILEFDKALRTLFVPAHTVRPVPSAEAPVTDMSAEEKRHAAALMRINHVGEVCAQALYQGQAVFCRDHLVKAELQKSGQEETEHLAWTERRIYELGGRKSVLNPLWYAGAFSIGLVAGKCGDAWSLGFVAETERQVEAHLNHHLDLLPANDEKSRAIVAQMKVDEMAHADKAERLGAKPLPAPVQQGMKMAAKVMTTLAYHL